VKSLPFSGQPKQRQGSLADAQITFSRGLLRQYFESNNKMRYQEQPEPTPSLDDANTPSLEVCVCVARLQPSSIPPFSRGKALIDMMLVLHEECSHSKFTDTGMRDFLAHCACLPLCVCGCGCGCVCVCVGVCAGLSLSCM
jgi:hypothetical protein